MFEAPLNRRWSRNDKNLNDFGSKFSIISVQEFCDVNLIDLLLKLTQMQ